MNCTRCNGTGFLNLDGQQGDTIEQIQGWMKANPDSDVTVCDCCGDGSSWYGEPGNHDPNTFGRGDYQPYAYNGGLPESS